MTDGESIFLDTVYVQGLLNARDQHHLAATQIFDRVSQAAKVVTTDAVLVEIGNALRSYDREAAVAFIRSCFVTANIEIVPVDSAIFEAGLLDYEKYSDKMWSLTDCISFIVMRLRGIKLAATADRHFTQAGFQVLMS